MRPNVRFELGNVFFPAQRPPDLHPGALDADTRTRRIGQQVPLEAARLAPEPIDSELALRRRLRQGHVVALVPVVEVQLLDAQQRRLEAVQLVHELPELGRGSAGFPEGMDHGADELESRDEISHGESE